MVLCYVVVQQGCSGNIAHQSGIIAAQKKHKPKHSHHREKKGHGPVQVLPQTRKLPPPIPPPPWAKVQALPLGSLHFAQGGGGMGGGIAPPLPKLEKLQKQEIPKIAHNLP